MKNVKNKKTFLIVGITLIAAAVGVTFAFSNDSSTMPNQFVVADYTVAYTEEFTAPQNWQPCEETPKTFTVKNEGNAAMNVRIRYEDYWRNKVDTQDLQPVKDGVTLVTINFQNENDWILKSDGYYHYKEPLEPGATTSSLFKSVTLNCDANFDKDNICTKTTNGTVCEKPADEYEGATYHLRIIAETKQVGADTFNDVMASQANPRDYAVDFRKKAVQSDDVFVANGNGVNRYTENGREIYYYRGEVENNNVIWANMCWKIIRSTATGGTKMIYNGLPSTVNGAKQCNATGAATQIGGTTYRFGVSSYSPADVGYKYGARIEIVIINPGSTVYTYSNKVSREGNTYTLDTSEGQSISGAWLDVRDQASARYHYFCTNGATTCSNTQIGYITYYNDLWTTAGRIHYLPVNGYNNIEDMKNAMFTNSNNSVAKSTIESWFYNNNLDGHVAGTKNYEDDLEDAVYCNDRTYAAGALKGEEYGTFITPPDSDPSSYSLHGAWANVIYYENDENITPVLECPTVRDSFTKSSDNGNGQLSYKVGLIDANEAALAGIPHYVFQGGETNYLYNGLDTWMISPYTYGANYAGVSIIKTYIAQTGSYATAGLRPVVSLKAGMSFIAGNGLKTNPYIVE